MAHILYCAKCGEELEWEPGPLYPCIRCGHRRYFTKQPDTGVLEYFRPWLLTEDDRKFLASLHIATR